MANKQRIHSPNQPKDSGGNTMDFHISDGENTVQDLTSGYIPPTKIRGFFICPLVSGTMTVRLLGQAYPEQFVIPTARVDAMVGFWMEEKISEIISSDITEALIGWAY